MNKKSQPIRADKRKPRTHVGNYWENPDNRDLYIGCPMAIEGNLFYNAARRVGFLSVKRNFTTNHLFIVLTVDGTEFYKRPLYQHEVKQDVILPVYVTLCDWINAEYKEGVEIAKYRSNMDSALFDAHKYYGTELKRCQL